MTEQEIAQALEGQFWRREIAPCGDVSVINVLSPVGRLRDLTGDDKSQELIEEVPDHFRKMMTILSLTCQVCGVDVSRVMVAKKPDPDAVFARSVFAWACKHRTAYTGIEIGSVLNARDPSSSVTTWMRRFKMAPEVHLPAALRVMEKFDEIYPAAKGPQLPPVSETQTYVTVAEIVGIAAAVTGTSVNGMMSRRRHGPTVKARAIAYWVAHQKTTASLGMIGKAIGGKDHTTVLHGIRTVEGDKGRFEPELSMVLAEIARRYPEQEAA